MVGTGGIEMSEKRRCWRYGKAEHCQEAATQSTRVGDHVYSHCPAHGPVPK